MRPVLRLLPLPLCIACSLAAYAADDRPADWKLCPLDDAVPVFSEAQATAAGSAQTRAAQPTDIVGDSLDGIDGQSMHYQGNVALKRGDQFLGTDNLTYDSQTERYVAEGNVRYQDSGMRMLADRAEGDQAADTHKIENVRYQLVSRRGNGGAGSIEMHGDNGALLGSTYSTCPPNARRWELRASRIDVNQATGFATARNATLRVGRIPVLYLPWFKFPVDEQRHTGLLYPAIASSGRNGFDWRQPIYLNLAPNYDATLTPRFMSQRGIMLGSEFRYLTDTGRGTFGLDYLPSDKLSKRGRAEEIAQGIPPENWRDDNRSQFRFNGYQNVSPQWQARADLIWLSDPHYVEDFSNSLNGVSNTSVTSNIGLYGRGRYWDAGVTADHWQLTDYTLRDANLPYDRIPRSYLRWERPYRRWLTAGLDAEVTRFVHVDSAARPGGNRLDLKPYLSLPFEGASWFVKPTFAWRHTDYQLDRDLAQAIATQNGGAQPDTSPSRSLPITTIDAGLFFDRNASIRGNRYLNTLEPRLFYLNAPYRDQSALPLFDTQPLTFSWGQLFRDNRYSGADRQSDANQLTLAMTTRFIRESDGLEKFSASLGQIRYFSDSRVVSTPCTTPPSAPCEMPLEENRSAWVAEASFSPNDRWTLGTTYQWDPKFRREDLASVRARYLVGDDGIVNFSYRYRRDLLEQADLSFLYPLNPSWSLVGRYYYSLKDRQMLEGIAGVQWDSCCLSVRLVGRRYVRNRLGELNDAIQLQIELKGLGSAGPDTESRLRRAILGYYREDLYLEPPQQLSSGKNVDTPDPAR